MASATPSSFFYVAGNASAANGTFTSAADLVSAIGNNASSVHGTITPTTPGGRLQLDSSGSITVAGAIGTAFGIGGSTNGNYNSTLASVTGTLTIGVSSNTAHSITFGSATGQVDTKAALTAAFAGFTDITAGYNGSNDILLTPQSTDNVTIGGTPATVTALGLNATVTTTRPRPS